MNLNDAMKNKPWSLTTENYASLRELLRIANDTCENGHEMFVHHPDFYPELRPHEYVPLVESVSTYLRSEGVNVNDGVGYLGKTELRDVMHFHMKSSRQLVQMLSEVIERRDYGGEPSSPASASPGPAHEAQPPSPVWSQDDVSSWVSGALERKHALDQEGEAEAEAKIINDFLEEVAAAQRQAGKPETPPESIHRYRRLRWRTPAALMEGDTRFAKKNDRVFVCDSCEHIVWPSSHARGTQYSRVECEVAGSWSDTSWNDIPGSLQRRAWELKLIDATWTCHQLCRAPMTGCN